MTSKNRYCPDCNKLIWNLSKYCRKCCFKHKFENHKYKQYLCKVCKNKISIPTFLYGKGRCNMCSKKGKLHPRLGVKLSAIIKNKISKSLIGKMNGKKSHFYKDGRTLKQHYCKICNKQISYNTACYRSGQCKSCSLTGKNNPNYQNGLSNYPYPLCFNNKLKQMIRNRDNFICQKCGFKNIKHKKIYKCELHVHHIDYNKNNCSEDNLITLCNKCNSIVNFNRNYWYAYFKYLMEDKDEVNK